MKNMKLIMENFKKFLEEANEEGKKYTLTYKKMTGFGGDDFEFEIDEESLKPEHKPKSKFDQPYTVGKMMQDLIEEKELELTEPYRGYNMATEQASVLESYLPEGTTLKKVIDDWAKLHGYVVEHPKSAKSLYGSEESEDKTSDSPPPGELDFNPEIKMEYTTKDGKTLLVINAGDDGTVVFNGENIMAGQKAIDALEDKGSMKDFLKTLRDDPVAGDAVGELLDSGRLDSDDEA